MFKARRTGVQWVCAVVLGLTLGATGLMVAPSAVSADQDLVVRMELLRWSGVNPDIFLVRVSDRVRGNKLEVRQCGNPVALVSQPVEPADEGKILAGDAFSPYSFVVGVKTGLVASNGWRVFGQKEANGVLRIGVASGQQALQLGVVQARVDPQTGKQASIELTNAFWSPDSLRVSAVVTQKTTGAWAIDVDEMHAFKIGK